jgi:hypothetical protein
VRTVSNHAFLVAFPAQNRSARVGAVLRLPPKSLLPSSAAGPPPSARLGLDGVPQSDPGAGERDRPLWAGDERDLGLWAGDALRESDALSERWAAIGLPWGRRGAGRGGGFCAPAAGGLGAGLLRISGAARGRG